MRRLQKVELKVCEGSLIPGRIKRQLREAAPEVCALLRAGVAVPALLSRAKREDEGEPRGAEERAELSARRVELPLFEAVEAQLNYVGELGRALD